MPIRFRPHHFLCALGFRGKGYSDAFTGNMARIVQDGLRGPGGDARQIEVVGATDDICIPCPHRRGTLCAKETRIAALDARHAAALNLAAGDLLTWGAAKERIRALVAPGDLSRLCAGCQWLAAGYCEGALRALHGAE
ncbi:hypothetical protein SAMN05444007_101402 [Cribrihabitans marinus]|uniref:DUF1284 domain-containing protein n=1 Tax=Cribrihabitans marinus TaxID=1227549 RepID=A0A1H6R512_9RHOB|nr:DUF1284 domain-containing protein [Cribrihabitans marinus]GGH20475.1 (2Fe-2S) ferredoxin [Cribrihabitans marinus]SEI50833.1 hypothetical protein SAMN05444007_101402 [Cribrihabitans marinus]